MTMKEHEYSIEGMSCAHCVMSVRKSLEKIPGVKVTEVVIGRARLNLDETKVSEEDIERAINDAGYAVVHA